eukprot:3812522-Lingulodinium_polyedra.AAC.1
MAWIAGAAFSNIGFRVKTQRLMRDYWRFGARNECKGCASVMDETIETFLNALFQRKAVLL